MTFKLLTGLDSEDEAVKLLNMEKRVTLRDIAAACDVHYSTVSLALRDHPRIPKELRQRIKEQAVRMGYVPDPALSALNAYRKTKLKVKYQASIAWIDAWKGNILLRDQPTFNEYFLGASTRARQLGYEVEEFRVHEPGMTPERLSRILTSRGIEALLLAPQMNPGTWLPMNYEKFAVITFGYSLSPQAFHLVTNHQYHSMTQSLGHLAALGYKRIGLYMHESIDEKADNNYITGYWNFFRRQPQMQTVQPCIVTKYNVDHEIFPEWFRQERPDAVITDSDLPVLDWMESLGVKVPDHAGCVWLSVGVDDNYHSGIYQNGHIVGQTALDFLVGMLQRGERGMPETPIRMLVEGRWTPGQTVRRM